MTYYIPTHSSFEASKPIYRATKRLFDIVAASVLLIILSPLFLIVAVLIRIESKGPVFYASKRVGEGYRVFDFYKFRSMRPDADQFLEKMKRDNQYGFEKRRRTPIHTLFSWCEFSDSHLVGDDGFIQESKWMERQMEEENQAFVKFKNDPRITLIGRFIRNTSIDELPQLVNVLKGDMSLVGNRPLPVYEASKLTSDEAVGRFLAPAGITGLWQVTERGKDKGSTDSRRRLDVKYAHNCSIFLDLKILLMTPLAMFQHENV